MPLIVFDEALILLGTEHEGLLLVHLVAWLRYCSLLFIFQFLLIRYLRKHRGFAPELHHSKQTS